jgi:5-methyltetrahydropteroyltriglutamate--homocysteine methyltransferase
VIKPAVFEFRDDHGHTVEFTAPFAEEKLYRTRPLALDEFMFLRDITSVTPKITLPSPSTMHFYRCSDFARKVAYRDVGTFFADLSTIYRQEIADLAKAGCRYIQLDEVAIALLCDPAIREKVEAAGEKPDALVDAYIESINDAVAAAPKGVAVGIHVCRGNFKGHYLASGGYESVAEQFFSRARATHFLLEYDIERAGDFKPLRFIKDQGVALGLISSKVSMLDARETLERRVREASHYLALERSRSARNAALPQRLPAIR